VAVFVILAVALAFMALGVAVVAALQLRRQAARLARTVQTSNGRLQSLTAELQAEAAVAGNESAAISQRIEEAGRQRARRRRRRWRVR
jgi:predicted PurR-regulated permease PerM